jgi:hypothetical protein
VLPAFEVELRQQISSVAASGCAVALDVATVGGPEPLGVALGAASNGCVSEVGTSGDPPLGPSGGAVAAEADPAMSMPEEPIIATPIVGVPPTSEVQSEGLDTGAPHQGEDELATRGEGTEGATFVPLSDLPPVATSSSYQGSGASVPDEGIGAYFQWWDRLP